jgi:hypothetical protein
MSSAKEQVLKNIKPETRVAIVHVFKDSDVWHCILDSALKNFTEIEGLAFFIKLSVTWKGFNEVFLKNEDVVKTLYYEYFHRTGIPKYPPHENYKNEPHYPDLTMKRSFAFPPKGWETPETLGDLDRRYFLKTALKVLVLAYTPWCSRCHTPQNIGLTESVPIWKANERLCIPCLKSQFVSNRELLQDYGFSIMHARYKGKSRKVINELRDMGALYFSLNSHVDNKVLLKLTDNPIDFVAGPEFSKKNAHSSVLLFWVPDLHRILPTEKIIFWGDKKKKAVNTIGAFFHRSLYRKIVTDAFQGARPHQYIEKKQTTSGNDGLPLAKKSKIEEPHPVIQIEWLNMDITQRKWVFTQLQARVTYFKMRPDPLQRFISDYGKDETKAHNILWRRAMNHASKFHDWDAQNIYPRTKKLQYPPAP